MKATHDADELDGVEPLLEFPGYGCTREGRVYSFKKNRFLKPQLTKRGYLNLLLCMDGVVKSMLVHRLIAMAFIPNPYSKPIINHIDNTTTNNHVSNLEWVTYSENMLHMVKQGRGKKQFPALHSTNNKEA